MNKWNNKICDLFNCFKECSLWMSFKATDLHFLVFEQNNNLWILGNNKYYQHFLSKKFLWKVIISKLRLCESGKSNQIVDQVDCYAFKQNFAIPLKSWNNIAFLIYQDVNGTVAATFWIKMFSWILIVFLLSHFIFLIHQAIFIFLNPFLAGFPWYKLNNIYVQTNFLKLDSRNVSLLTL